MGQSESKQEQVQQIEGGIHIQIPRNQFYSGDIISGQILIDLNTQFEGKSLIVQLQGIEKTQFFEADQQDDKNRSNRILRLGYNEFHDLRIKAFDFTQGSGIGRTIIGQWRLPFQIVIADYLPSSFSYEAKDFTNCSLKYNLVAYIEPSDSRKQPISVSQEINVIQTQNHIEAEPQSVEYQSNPVVCFCCLAGSIDMQAQIDKKFYDYLEEMTINFDCDAAKCLQKVPSFAVKIQGRLDIKSNTNHSIEHKFDIYKQTYNTTEDFKINKSVQIRIPKSTNIGTQGALIKYQNYIVIEPQISTLLSVSSNPPLLIPFFVSSFTAQNNNDNNRNNHNNNFQKAIIIPQIHPVELQQNPQMQIPQFQPIIKFDQPNYNYPTETVILKQEKHDMNPPIMECQYTTVTGQ